MTSKAIFSVLCFQLFLFSVMQPCVPALAKTFVKYPFIKVLNNIHQTKFIKYKLTAAICLQRR